jgi:hypothetical protein
MPQHVDAGHKIRTARLVVRSRCINAQKTHREQDAEARQPTNRNRRAERRNMGFLYKPQTVDLILEISHIKKAWANCCGALSIFLSAGTWHTGSLQPQQGRISARCAPENF